MHPSKLAALRAMDITRHSRLTAAASIMKLHHARLISVSNFLRLRVTVHYLIVLLPLNHSKRTPGVKCSLVAGEATTNKIKDITVL